MPETDGGPAGELFDHGAAEDIFHHHIGIAYLARWRFAALLTVSAGIEDAALLLAVGDHFAHAIADAPAAVVAQGSDREQLILGLESDGLELRLFREQTRDLRVRRHVAKRPAAPRHRDQRRDNRQRREDDQRERHPLDPPRRDERDADAGGGGQRGAHGRLEQTQRQPPRPHAPNQIANVAVVLHG